ESLCRQHALAANLDLLGEYPQFERLPPRPPAGPHISDHEPAINSSPFPAQFIQDILDGGKQFVSRKTLAGNSGVEVRTPDGRRQIEEHGFTPGRYGWPPRLPHRPSPSRPEPPGIAPALPGIAAHC